MAGEIPETNPAHCNGLPLPKLVALKNWLQLRHVSRSILAASGSDSDELFLCGQIPEAGVKTFYQLYSFHINVGD